MAKKLNGWMPDCAKDCDEFCDDDLIFVTQAEAEFYDVLNDADDDGNLGFEEMKELTEKIFKNKKFLKSFKFQATKTK